MVRVFFEAVMTWCVNEKILRFVNPSATSGVVGF